jgi:hypothetical protein
MKIGIDNIRYVIATLVLILVMVFQAGEATSKSARTVKKQSLNPVNQKMKLKMMRFGLFGNQILLTRIIH